MDIKTLTSMSKREINRYICDCAITHESCAPDKCSECSMAKNILDRARKHLWDAPMTIVLRDDESVIAFDYCDNNPWDYQFVPYETMDGCIMKQDDTPRLDTSEARAIEYLLTQEVVREEIQIGISTLFLRNSRWVFEKSKI